MTCAFCDHELEPFMDLGNVALAGAFMKEYRELPRYPLALGFCPGCYAVSVMEPVKPVDLFTDYFYFSSATETAKAHFRDLARVLVEHFHPKTAIEIGCNDGALLRPLANAGVRVMGIDPSNAVHGFDDPRIQIVNDYFPCGLTMNPVDLIVACNVFAHVEDPNGVTVAARDLLTDDGVLVLEVHSLDEMVAGLQYDWIYHEHRHYLSLLALMRHFERHGMQVFDLDQIPAHGGSLRLYVDKGKRPVTAAVASQMRLEVFHGLDRVETFRAFAARAKEHQAALRLLLSGKVAGYGACGRSTSLIQSCGLELDYMVDDAPAKQGRWTPTGLPIHPSRYLHEVRPDAVLVFAWPYLEEVRPKCTGLPLIVPFPTPELVL